MPLEEYILLASLLAGAHPQGAEGQRTLGAEVIVQPNGGAANDMMAAVITHRVRVPTSTVVVKKPTVGHSRSGANASHLKVPRRVIEQSPSWANDDESPKETVTFEYGGMVIHPTGPKGVHGGRRPHRK
jgi:hypothetical protein